MILNLKSAISLEYQNIKTFLQTEKVFVIKKFKYTVPWAYFISDLKDKEIVETFCEKESQKTNLKEFRLEKVIKRKDDKVYVKWRGYDSSFNS